MSEIVITAGMISAMFTVDITDDSVVEEDEAFLARISNATASGVSASSIIINPRKSAVSILDEDGEYGYVLIYFQTPPSVTYVYGFSILTPVTEAWAAAEVTVEETSKPFLITISNK